MTNKERLEANNEKIKAIQETLKNKILSLDNETEEIEIVFPEEFKKTVSYITFEIYNFKVSDDVVLFSSYAGNGLWEYTISTKTWKQLINDSYTYKNFQMIDNNCIVSASSSNGITISYDINAKTFQQLYNKGGFDRFNFIKDACVFSSTINKFNDLLLYKNNQVTLIDTTSGNTHNYVVVCGNKMLRGAVSSSSYDGIYRYDYDTGSYDKIYTGGYAWEYFTIVNNKIFISSPSVDGLLMYDCELDTIEPITTSWKYRSCVFNIGNLYLISNDSSSTKGLYLYDLETKEYSQIYTSGYYYAYHFQIGNNILFSSSTTSTEGVYLFDSTTRTVSKIYTKDIRWDIYHIVGNFCYISSSYAQTMYGGNGILKFNIDDNSIVNLFDHAVFYFDKLKIDGNTLYFSSSDKTSPYTKTILKYVEGESKATVFGYKMEV